jgi:ABC-type multidrug transport system fused ATPase/permease subunit
MRYRPELPLVLKGVSANIRAREKIGICGRTGSGTSSLIACLFRSCEYERGGVIKIDGVDIRTIGLGALRSGVGIIPQNPTLFTGSVRSNLDPFGTYSDEEIWQSLGFCSMSGVIEALPGQLAAPVAEFGENFSQGERQLLTVARALLYKPTVLIMDEATASIDMKTDQLIQQSIREKFVDSTVLTIAHRLDSILHCDRIMVLNQGRLAEFDTPLALSAIPNGQFAGYLADSNLSADDIRQVNK